ncbi:hypothetical protein ANCDUO_08696 [Ancylostoma duodenale]|uniref:G-protein coupled receptors family 1 profile domain-containing protein n=1 Tax=Ancylostoma duodenale TaxID=51022 RepID=A0A0C2GPP6_9BILA|nr:hypothetical protein ANCDUO_08696 [Ancylostoma duodenale]
MSGEKALMMNGSSSDELLMLRLIEEDERLQPEWGYLTLSIVPFICIIGNCMVVAAVWTTRSLQTPTNHLLVSLAMADLIVGAFVMPFSIYLSYT